MGITLSRKREAAAGSIACMAAIPREEMARLIDRCWAASREEGKRISSVDFTLRKIGSVMKEECTRAGLVDFDGPTHLCKGNGGETAHRASTNYDKFSSHVLDVAIFNLDTKSRRAHFHSTTQTRQVA